MHGFFESIFGTPEEFFQRYESFQNEYLQALERNIDPIRARNVDIDFLRSGGSINLNVLEKRTADALRERYMHDVLRLPRLFKQAGIPGVELPSANLFRRAFRYEVDTSRTGGEMHPMQVLINRAIFNVDPAKEGMDAFNIGSQNIMGLRGLKQTSRSDLGTLLNQGRTIKMLDTESTSVFQSHQIRQMSILDMKLENGKAVWGTPKQTLNFASPQMAGITVAGKNGTLQSMNDFVMGQSRGSINARNSADFLDNMTNYVNYLLEGDSIITGHNIFFDLQMISDTMKSLPEFGSNKQAQLALSALQKAMTEEGRVVDSLDYAREYINNLVNQAVDNSNLTNNIDKYNKFRSLLYSPEFVSKIRAGGAAPYASMEAIAMNTNILDLLYADAQSDDMAADLFKQIFSGTHIAETDAKLQAYMTGLIVNEKLQLRDYETPSELAVDASRKVISQSASITLTTSVIDPDNISRDILEFYMTSPNARNRKASMFGGIVLDLEENALAGIGGRKASEAGRFYFDQKEGVYKLATSTGIESIDAQSAESILRDTLENAGRVDQQVRFGSTLESISIPNVQARRIAQLPFDYTELSQATEMKAMAQAVSGAQNVSELTAQNLLDNLGITYKDFGRSLNIGEMVEVAAGRLPAYSNFELGLSNYGLPAGASGADLLNAASRFALARNSIMNQYSVLDPRSSVLSTIMSESTAENARIARNNIVAKLANATTEEEKNLYRSQLESLKYADIEDILPEYGISHFKKQTTTRIMSATDRMSSRLFLPTDVINEVSKKVFADQGGARVGRLQLSFADVGGETVANLFWNLGSDIGADQQKTFVSSLFNHIYDTVDGMKASQKKLEENLALVKAKDDLKALEQMTGSRAAAEEIFLEQMQKGGLGYASESGQLAERLRRSLEISGYEPDNEGKVLASLSARVIDELGDTVRVSAFANDLTLEAAGISDQLRSADDAQIVAKNKIAEMVGSEEGFEKKLRKSFNRKRMGREPSKVVDFYVNNKNSIRNVGLGLLAAGAGYYIYKNYQENQYYDETTDQQPYENSYGRTMNSGFSQQDLSSYRRDPLVTAGVVGNLDRNKIGHTNMGPNKYNHLFGN